MATAPDEGRADRRPQGTRTGPGGKPGAWLPWPMAEALCHLTLHPPSRWQVLVAVLVTSCRYGGGEARLGVDDLAGLTGLAPRTVKGALKDLIDRGLVRRVGRYKRLTARLPGGDQGRGGANTPAPPGGEAGSPGGADTRAPRRGKHACPSPTCIW
jgi:hypothetical protein